ncbi:winged helix-turn-helix transcriptional regulator [Mucilaginibacter sp. HD30]
MKHKTQEHFSGCMGKIRPVADTMYVLNGKWKVPILIALSFGPKRFGELSKDIPKITDRMLSKELRELEANDLVKRTVQDTIPVIVEYTITEYGHSLDFIISELSKWGIKHREHILNKVAPSK